MGKKDLEPVHVLCICGTGVAGAAIVHETLRTLFAELKIPVQLETGASIQMETLFETSHVDMIVHTSILPRKFGVPSFLAIPLYTGIGEKEMLEGIRQAAREIWAKKLDDAGEAQ
jgi:galactitol-specific phosphotransferase system IIB component